MSTSVSLVSTLPVTGVSSVPAKPSATPAGASFTGVRLSVTVVRPLSDEPSLAL